MITEIVGTRAVARTLFACLITTCIKCSLNVIGSIAHRNHCRQMNASHAQMIAITSESWARLAQRNEPRFPSKNMIVMALMHKHVAQTITSDTVSMIGSVSKPQLEQSFYQAGWMKLCHRLVLQCIWANLLQLHFADRKSLAGNTLVQKWPGSACQPLHTMHECLDVCGVCMRSMTCEIWLSDWCIRSALVQCTDARHRSGSINSCEFAVLTQRFKLRNRAADAGRHELSGKQQVWFHSASDDGAARTQMFFNHQCSSCITFLAKQVGAYIMHCLHMHVCQLLKSQPSMEARLRI